MEDIIKIVNDAVTSIIEDLGYELVDVTYEYLHKAMNLTVFIYKPEGITLADCEKVHYAIDAKLDEIDPTKGAPYNLNVSSPGLDRPIKTERDFKRNMGKAVEVRLKKPINKKNIIEGILINFDNNKVGIQNEKNAEIVLIDIEDIKLMTLLIKF